MPLRQDVQDAFATLGLTPDVDLSEATKAYKRLALLHHPDRNHNDPSATQRFQQASVKAADPACLFSPTYSRRLAMLGTYARNSTIILLGQIVLKVLIIRTKMTLS